MLDVDIEQSLGDFRLAARFATEAPVTGVFGRSGAGKTSLVNAIAGVTRPERGHIRVGDNWLFDAARGVDLPSPRRRVGYVFQDALLFPHLSVRANLHYGQRLRPVVERFIDAARVIDVLGLATLLDRRPASLSGGEKQRVAIGRALLAQPRILLLDEPLASLDLPRKTEILDYIERLRDAFRIPIVYVSHAVPEITRLADAVVVLSEGRCIAAGDVDEVMGRVDLRPFTGRYEAGAVIEATVTAHDTGDRLTTLGFSGGELIVPGLDAAIGSRVRARIRARDVSLAVQRPAGISILNVLHGRVTSIQQGEGPVADVALAVGDAAIVAQITRRSLAQLGIREGIDIHALVKAVSFDRHSTGYVAPPRAGSDEA
ncbi:MAG TPA: molybdenum ABC transporter ATP-binding protein [Casimicrobiaceae bacterium]|jgi:molybdate transport system ATP-binding protein